MSGPVREAPLVEALLGPARAEVGCDACFRELDRYVEIELAGGNAERALPGVRTHLDGCAACRQEYWGLCALLRGRRRFSHFSTG